MQTIFTRTLLTLLLCFGAVCSSAAQECPGPGQIVLNEIRYTPKGLGFIELWGPAGADLSCLKLMSYNGGQDGTVCDASLVLAFESGHVLGEDGYFLIAEEDGEGVDLVSSKANLQDGPDGLQLQVATTGEVLDSVAYGGPLEACETPVMEGDQPAPLHNQVSSIGRYGNHQDTNQNKQDWGVCPEPTPGADNNCPQAPSCDTGPDGTVLLNELRLGPGGEEFVELRGQAGADLGCYTLRTWNGGSANDVCDLDEEFPLVGQLLDAQGYHVAEFDLQKGPDALELLYVYGDGGEALVDAVVWKEAMPQCGGAIGQLAALPVPPDGNSLSRCKETGDVSKDFEVTLATAGEQNLCPTPCGPPTANVVINEVVIDPNEAAFVELKGPAGQDMSCFRLVELNGGQDADQCSVETDEDLNGLVIPEDGYLVLGAADVPSLDVTVSFAAQNGPGDGLRLIYDADDGPLVMDTFSWGAPLAACIDPPQSDSGFGPIVKEGNSISHCPDGRDTNNNNVDLFEAEGATPGGPNACPDLTALAVCDQLPTSPIVINELQTSPASMAFIELKGAPNTAMGCYSLIAYNGGPDGDRCDIYETIEMQGAAIGPSGYFTIAPEGSDWGGFADVNHPGADLQDGPDALALLFTSTAGQVLLMDAVVYGGELPLCDDFNEGPPAEKIGKDRSITRCEGNDTNNNEADFTLCSVPSPGETTTCNCGIPNPSGGSVSVEEPAGCAQRPWVDGRWILWLAGMILGLLTVFKGKRFSI